MDPFSTQSQMSIFKILTDNRSMYPSMYQVMYVEKNFSYVSTYGCRECMFVSEVGSGVRAVTLRMMVLLNLSIQIDM